MLFSLFVRLLWVKLRSLPYLSLHETESLRVAMSHAGQWLNTARRVLAHVRAYLDSGQYGERRDSEQAQACECRHGDTPAK